MSKKSYTVNRRNFIFASGLGILAVSVPKSVIFGEARGNRVVVVGGRVWGYHSSKICKKACSGIGSFPYRKESYVCFLSFE